MLRFAADENFNGRVLRGLMRRVPELDVVRIQDAEVAGCDDRALLAWCSAEQRVLLTHDVATVTAFAQERLRAALEMPGVIEASPRLSIGQVIGDLELLALAGRPEDLRDRIIHLPL